MAMIKKNNNRGLGKPLRKTYLSQLIASLLMMAAGSALSDDIRSLPPVSAKQIERYNPKRLDDEAEVAAHKQRILEEERRAKEFFGKI